MMIIKKTVQEIGCGTWTAILEEARNLPEVSSTTAFRLLPNT